MRAGNTYPEGTEMITTELATEVIELAKVTKTYSGETGCACGCAGSYAYAESGNEPGYFVEGNPRTLKMRVNKINKAIQAGLRVEVTHYDDESIYELENEAGTRAVRVYVAH